MPDQSPEARTLPAFLVCQRSVTLSPTAAFCPAAVLTFSATSLTCGGFVWASGRACAAEDVATTRAEDPALAVPAVAGVASTVTVPAATVASRVSTRVVPRMGFTVGADTGPCSRFG